MLIIAVLVSAGMAISILYRPASPRNLKSERRSNYAVLLRAENLSKECALFERGAGIKTSATTASVIKFVNKASELRYVEKWQATVAENASVFIRAVKNAERAGKYFVRLPHIGRYPRIYLFCEMLVNYTHAEFSETLLFAARDKFETHFKLEDIEKSLLPDMLRLCVLAFANKLLESAIIYSENYAKGADSGSKNEIDLDKLSAPGYIPGVMSYASCDKAESEAILYDNGIDADEVVLLHSIYMSELFADLSASVRALKIADALIPDVEIKYSKFCGRSAIVKNRVADIAAIDNADILFFDGDGDIKRRTFSARGRELTADNRGCITLSRKNSSNALGIDIKVSTCDGDISLADCSGAFYSFGAVYRAVNSVCDMSVRVCMSPLYGAAVVAVRLIAINDARASFDITATIEGGENPQLNDRTFALRKLGSDSAGMRSSEISNYENKSVKANAFIDKEIAVCDTVSAVEPFREKTVFYIVAIEKNICVLKSVLNYASAEFYAYGENAAGAYFKRFGNDLSQGYYADDIFRIEKGLVFDRRCEKKKNAKVYPNGAYECDGDGNEIFTVANDRCYVDIAADGDSTESFIGKFEGRSHEIIIGVGDNAVTPYGGRVIFDRGVVTFKRTSSFGISIILRRYLVRGKSAEIFDIYVKNKTKKSLNASVLVSINAPNGFSSYVSADRAYAVDKVGSGFCLIASENCVAASTCSAYKRRGKVVSTHDFSKRDGYPSPTLSVPVSVDAGKTSRVVFCLSKYESGYCDVEGIDLKTANKIYREIRSFYSKFSIVMSDCGGTFDYMYTASLYAAYAGLMKSLVSGGDLIAALISCFAVKYASESETKKALFKIANRIKDGDDNVDNIFAINALFSLAAADYLKFCGAAATGHTLDESETRILNFALSCADRCVLAIFGRRSAAGRNLFYDTALYYALCLHRTHCGKVRQKAYAAVMPRLKRSVDAFFSSPKKDPIAEIYAKYREGDYSAAFDKLSLLVEKLYSVKAVFRADEYYAELACLYVVVTEKLFGVDIEGGAVKFAPCLRCGRNNVSFGIRERGGVRKISVSDSEKNGEWRMTIGKITYPCTRVKLADIGGNICLKRV